MYGARGLSRDAENILQLTREQQEQLGRANRDEDDWQMDLSQWKAKRRKSKNASVTSSGETLPPPSLVDSFDNVFGDSNLSPSEGKPIPDKKDSSLAKAEIAADDFDALVEANKKHADETNGEPLITSSMLTINMEQPKQAPPTKPAVSQSPKKSDPLPTNKLSTPLSIDTKPTNQRSPSTAETNVSKDTEKPKYVSESLEHKTVNTPAYYQPANAHTSNAPEPAVSVEKPVDKPVIELPLAIETLTWQLESSPDILAQPKLDVQVSRPNRKDNFSEGLHMVTKTTKDADAGEGDVGGGTSSDSDESSCPPPPPLPPSPPPNPPARRESLDSLLKYAATSAAAAPSVGDVTAPIPGEKRKLTRTQREAQRKRNELLGIPLTEEMERDSNDDEVEQISQHNTETMQDHVDLDRGQLLLGNNAYVSKLDDVFITSDTNNNKPTDSKAAETSKESGVVQPANDHIVLLAHHKPTPVKINYRSRSRDWRPPITSGENTTSNSNIRPTDRQQPIEKVEQPKQHSTTNAELPRSKPDSLTSQPIRSKNNDVIQTSRDKPQFATEDVRLSVRETRAKTTVVQPQLAVSTSLIGQPFITAPAIGQPNFAEPQQPRLVDRQPFSERLRETNNSKSALLTTTVPLKLEDSPAKWTAVNHLQRHNSLPEMAPRPQTANQTSTTPTRSTAAKSVQVSHLPYRDWLNLASSNNQLSWSAYAITGSKKPSPTTNQYNQHNQYRGRPPTANTDRYTPSRRSQSENSRPQSAGNDWLRGSRDYNPNQWRNVPSSTPTKATNNVNQSTARFYGSNDNFDRRPRSSHSPQRHNNNYYNKDERKYYSDNEASTKRNHYTVYPSHAANVYATGNSTVLPNNAYNNNNNNNKENWDAWTGHTMEAKMRRRDAQKRFQEMENDLLQQQATGSGHHVVRRHTVSSPQPASRASRLHSSSPSFRYNNGISPNSPNRRYNGSYGYNGTNDNSHLQQQFSPHQSPSQYLHPLQQQQQLPSPGKPVPSDELFGNNLSPKPKRILQQFPTDIRQTVQGPPKPQRTHHLPYPIYPPQTPTSPQSNGVPIVAMKTRGQGQGHPPVNNNQYYHHQLRRTGSVPQLHTHRRSAPPSTLVYQQPLPSNRQDYASQPIRRQLTPTNYNTGSQYQLVGCPVHRSQSARNIQSQSYYVPRRHNDGLFQAPPYPVNHRQAPPPPLIIRSSADQLNSSPVSPSLFNGAPRPKERVMPPSSPTKINTQTPPTQLSPFNLATRPSQISPVTSQPPPIKPQLFASTATSPTNQRHADVTGKPTLPKFVLPSVPAATVSPGPISPVRSVHEPVSRRDLPPDDVIPLSPRTPVGSTQHLSPALLSYNLGQSSVQLEPEKFCAACNQQIDTLGQYHTLPDEANIYFHTDCFHCSVCLTKLNTQANIHLRNGKLHCRHCDSNDLGLKLSSV